jgi:hypothetical protein
MILKTYSFTQQNSTFIIGCCYNFVIWHNSVLNTLPYLNNYTNIITIYKILSQSSWFRLTYDNCTVKFCLYYYIHTSTDNDLKVNWVQNLVTELPVCSFIYKCLNICRGADKIVLPYKISPYIILYKMFPSNLSVRILHIRDRMENRIEPPCKSEFMIDPILGWYFNLITTADQYVQQNMLILLLLLAFFISS